MKVRATLMKDMAGVQDVFCGPETVVYVKNGSVAVAPDAIREALEGFELQVDSVERDDSALL